MSYMDDRPNHNNFNVSLFTKFARRAAMATGRPITFAIAVAVIIAWALTGPLFGFSDTWQLVINTGTTIITFLMVFLIQHPEPGHGSFANKIG